MIGAVEAVTGEPCHVDPSDECNDAVDDHELLVVAMERVLTRIRLTPDTRAAREGPHRVGDFAPSRVEDRHRRARPDEHAHIKPLSRLGKQWAEHRWCPVAHELESRIDVPAGDMHRLARSCDRPRDRRERRGPVNEHIELVARPRLGVTGRPWAAIGRLERANLPESAQTPAMLETHRRLNRVADDRVNPRDT
jgi:hypothetical protein